MPIPLLASAGLSLLGSALGSGAARGARKRQDQLLQQSQNYLNETNALRPQYQGFADDATAAYDQFQPQSIEATQDYADSLRRDKYTGDYSNAVLGKATSGVTDAYLRAKANIAASNAEKGITDSNVGIGANIANENAYAGQLGNAQINLGLERIDDRERRLQQLAQVLTGATSANRGAAMDSLGQVDNVNRYLSNAYAGMAGVVGQDAAGQEAGVSGMFGDIGSLASALMSKKRTGEFGLDPSWKSMRNPNL